MRFGLYPKTILLMVSLAVIPVGFAGFQLIAMSQEGLQSSIMELQTKLAEKLAQGVGQSVKATDEKARFALLALDQPLPAAEKDRLLKAFLDSQEGAAEIALLDPSGKESLRAAARGAGGTGPQDRSRERGYAAMRATGRRQLELMPASRPRLRAFYPMRDGRACYLSMFLTGSWQRFETERIGGTGIAVLAAKDGTPILYPRDAGLEPGSLRELAAVKRGVASAVLGSLSFTDAAGRRMVGSYAPLKDIGGAVVIIQPQREAFAVAYRMRLQALMVLVVFGVLALVISMWTARQISLPILRVTDVAASVARGDFSKLVEIESDDELRDLAATFNHMTTQLRKYHEMQVDRIILEERKTEAILFSIADGILMTDYDGRIQLANRMARSVLGLSPTEDLEGRRLQELMPDPAIRGVLEEVSTSPQENLHRELDLSTDMYRRIFRVSAQPVIAPGKGTPLGIVTALHDVTLEKELEKMKEDFVQSMTHDLRSPIASIRGFVEILLKGEPGPLTPVQQKMLDSMDKASFRLLGMINNILDMAKMRSGRMDLQLIGTAINEVVERVLETMGPLARRKGIDLVFNGDPGGKIKADPDLLERVFTNLVGNAIKFTPEDGKILISVRDDGNEVRCSVEDTGHGIPAEYRSKIFERFAQVGGQRAGGTGLGLAICKFIVELHRGRIWVESEPEAGSHFYFTLSKHLTERDVPAMNGGKDETGLIPPSLPAPYGKKD